ncbi:zinc finger CCCH domain-containing protein 33-like [Panicum virgatum]|uniref:zinc finger CCCH domain-containing protein 33-like n=1 Tax=Panicum virgatum TaxID=38727 RepID=UPI0019D56AFA|nr:zinc finger CCCH domain-containing protein 33-like [Panicum virgatum]
MAAAWVRSVRWEQARAGVRVGGGLARLESRRARERGEEQGRRWQASAAWRSQLGAPGAARRRSPVEAAHASPTNGTTPFHLTTAGGAAGAITAAHLLTAGVSADALAFSGLCAGDLLPHANATAERGTGSSVCCSSLARCAVVLAQEEPHPGTRSTADRDPPSRSPPAAAGALQQAPLPAAGVAARPAAALHPRPGDRPPASCTRV